MLKAALCLLLLLVVCEAKLRFPIHRKLVTLRHNASDPPIQIRTPRARLGQRVLSPKLRKKLGITPKMLHNTPLRGNWTALALWYMTIDIGVNHQTFHVQVDTGSSDLGVPNVGCECGHHLDAPFDPSKDPSASPVPCSTSVLACTEGEGASCEGNQCGYTISYADGSGYTAVMYNDTITFGSVVNNGIPLRSQYFGAIINEVTPNGPFEPTAVDGIVGFAQQSLSVVEAPPPIQTLVTENKSCPFVFSMCGDVSHKGGVLTVCGYGDFTGGPIQWTPMVQYDQGFYNVDLVDFAVNGKHLGVAASKYQQATVDSGTTLLLIPNAAFNAMKSIFLANCSKNYLHGVCDAPSGQTLFDGACFSMTPAQVAAFPTLTAFMGKSSAQITVTFPPSSYVVPGFCSDTTQYSFGIQPGGSTGTILGDPIMISNEVIYDVAHRRMGFAPKKNCFYTP